MSKEFYNLTIPVAGIDLNGMMELGQGLAEHEDIARKCKFLEPKIKDYQDSFTAIEKVSLCLQRYNYRDIIQILSTFCIVYLLYGFYR